MAESGGFEVEAGTLRVRKDLYWEDHERFLGRCRELLGGSEPVVTIDLGDCGFVFSTYLGVIGNLFVEAKEKNKRLKLRVSKRIEWIFHLAGFREMLEVEVVD